MEPNVKGYAIEAATQFILDDAELLARIPAPVVDDLRKTRGTFVATQWYPRSILMVRYRAVAEAARSEKEAYDTLVRCGRATAGTAIKGYLKLLLRVLTPKMFAGKFADFWARDHQSGHAKVDVVEGHRLVIFFKDVGGFDHIGPVATGFVSFAMGAIGTKDVEADCTPWSLAEPAPQDVRVEIRWR